MEQDNKMTPGNLGIVFGPTLLRPRPTEATVSLSSLVDYPHQARVIETLIVHYGLVFEEEPEEVPGGQVKKTMGGDTRHDGGSGYRSVVERQPSMQEPLGPPPAPGSQAALWVSHPSTQRWRKVQEFKAILSHRTSLKLAWATREPYVPVSEKQKHL